VSARISVGRIVHFWQQADNGPLAAIVTRVNPEGTLADLAVFMVNGFAFVPEVPQGRPGRVRTWSWPERV